MENVLIFIMTMVLCLFLTKKENAKRFTCNIKDGVLFTGFIPNNLVIQDVTDKKKD